MHKEWSARWIVSSLVIVTLAIPAWGWWQKLGWVEVHAAMPQRGGWLTDRLTARVGEPLDLRLISDDVTHGFAVGQTDFEPLELLPGQPVEVSLIFDQPGTYTFYCTRWCGADHWRMRGTITVIGDEGPSPVKAPKQPLYLQLGLDLDVPHRVPGLVLDQPPSAARGAALIEALSLNPSSPDPSLSPYALWKTLRADPQTFGHGDQDLWDIVAWKWQQTTSAEALAEGQALYVRDCAACHGVSGAGDGVFGAVVEAGDEPPNQTAPDGHSIVEPVDFTNPAQMLGASPALLQGKILRGGMGTGMPSWGLIYTEAQTWSLVDYLWTFLFQYSFEE